MLRGTCLGLALGLVIGWLVWAGPLGTTDQRAEERGARSDLPGAARAHGTHAPVLNPATEGGQSTRPGLPRTRTSPQPPLAEAQPASRSAIFRSGSWAAVREASTHTPLIEEEVDALVERLRASQRSKERGWFVTLLHILGASGHPKAGAFLVTLAADVDADVPPDFAVAVGKFLLKKPVPGASAAALARVESGQKSPPWVPIIMLQGTPAEIEQALAFTDGRVSYIHAYLALMARPLNEALPYLRQAQAMGPPRVSPWRALRAFAQNHHDKGLELVVEAILALDAGQDAGFGDANPSEPLHTYVTMLHHKREWPAAARLLSGLRTESMRLAAVRTLSIWGLGFDLAPVKDLLGQPAISLRKLMDTRPLPPDAGKRIRNLAVTISEKRALLTEANVTALEYAAEHWSGEHKQEVQRAAKAARTALTTNDWHY